MGASSSSRRGLGFNEPRPCTFRSSVSATAAARKLFIFALVATAFGVRGLSTAEVADEGTAAEAAAGGERPPPNIILILTDDQGYGDLSSNGNPVLETPNIDRLAKESASLAYFYVSPVCTPTRASLMTGRYSFRTRAFDTYLGRAMMDPAEVTLAEILGGAGYRTGIFGKWHLGDCYPMRPSDQGFHESLVHRGGGLGQSSEPVENERRYTNPVLFRNNEKVQTRGYCTDVYFDAAIAFLRECEVKGAPFFAYIATNAPHSPFHDVPQALYEKYRERDIAGALGEEPRQVDTIARIFAMVENIDDNVGKLLAALEALGNEKDTIVVYLHDNGPHLLRWVAGLRGAKTHVYEGGIRTPFFVRWPARLRAGATSPGIGAHIDLLPTLLAAANVSVPVGLRLDGRNLLPWLEGKATVPLERTLFIQAHRGDQPARFHQFAARGPRWKLLRASRFGRPDPDPASPFELFDLANDPQESRNLAAEHPEIVARLKAEYGRWFDDVSSTRPDNYAPPRIVVGSDHETRTVLTRQDWRRVSGEGARMRGEWFLTIEGNFRYEIQVLTKTEVQDAKVEVRAAGGTRSQVFAGAGKAFVLPSIPLRAGDTRFAVEISTGAGYVKPHQVILERRGTPR